MEDKWYGVLDKADSHVPIYKIIDPIDKIVPSFVLFIAIILIIAAFLILPMLAPVATQVSVTVFVANDEGKPMEGATVDYTIAGTIDSRKTNAEGKVLFNAPFESSVDIGIADTTIKGVEYAGATEKITLGKEPTYSKKITLTKKAAAIERTIIFQNSAGERITGEAIRIRLSCQNPVAKLLKTDAIDEDKDGEIKVTEPADCRLLQATIIAPAKFKQKSYNISNSAQTLQLEELDIAKGAVRVKIKDESGNLLTETNFSVRLLETDGSLANEKYSRNYGEAFFTEVKIGTYNASVSDDAGDYALATAEGIEVKVNETTQADVIVSKTVKAKITVQVIDKASKKAIANATVKLLNPDGRILDEQSTGSEAKSILFALKDALTYTLQASHSDYLYEEVKVEKATADTNIAIQLEKLTALNSGRVEVKVVDEEGKAVAKAKVKLRFLESGMLVPIEPRLTDLNGIARFTGVKAGSYYAYAEKFPASGDSKAEGKEIDIRETTRFTIEMFIGKTNVTVKAVDEDNKQVPEAEAEFFAESGESLGKIALTDGTGKFELKADKRVFVIVSHANFMPVQTMPAQLFPSQKIEFVAKMEPKLVLGDPKVQFEGVFDSTGLKQVQMLKAGNTYIAKFKLSVPSSGNFRQAGFHFRVGDEQLSANDPLVIKDVIAGGISPPLKGTSFSPPAGYAEDEQNVTEGDAKWANIFWNGLQPMNYYFGFEIRVKSQVMPYTKLSMHYRAWAIDESGDYIRAPADSALGVAESTAEKQALYAEKFTVQFLEGSPAKCEEDFCYSGESILDEDKGLFVMEPYQLNAGAPHKLTFDIINNSERQYSSAKLYITAVGLTIDSYKIKNADAREISAANLATKKIEEIDLGEFTKGKSINSIVHFNASTIGNASIEIKIIADARTVFLRTITAAVESEKQMHISIDPALIAAYIPNRVQISASEDIGGQTFGVDNALVRLTLTHPNKVTQFFKNNTNGLGKTSFDLPALQPSTKIVIEVEKPGYYAAPLELFVDSNILRFDPNEIRSQLDTRGMKEQTFAVAVQNMTGMDVEIKNIALHGQFKGLLDQATMLNFTKQYIGTKIKAGDSITREMFKTKLSENARQLLLRNEKLNGQFVITATNSERTITWDMVVPLQAAISIGELPDNAPCIVVTKQEWSSSTVENIATIEFEVQNSCMSGSNFVELDNLQAKMEWQGDAIGTVELTIIEAETGASNSAVLRPEIWTQLFKTIRPDSTYYAMLSFTPKQGHIGETAKFSVFIDGQIATGAGLTFVGAKPDAINSTIKVINLQQCIKYEDAENIVKMAGGQNDTKFTIDSSDCGNIAVSIELCRQNPNCAGGAEGGIAVTPLSFTLTKDNASKEISVGRQSIAGMYGINVEAKVPGTSFREVNNIDILIEPATKTDFSLEKYELNIKGIGAKDEAMLSNSALAEQIQVDASACDWGTAEKKGMFDLAGAGMGAAVAALMGAQTAIQEASKGAKGISNAKYTDMTGSLTQSNMAMSKAQTANLKTEIAKTSCGKANDSITTADNAANSARGMASGIMAGCDEGAKQATTEVSTETGQISGQSKETFGKSAASSFTTSTNIFDTSTTMAGNTTTAHSTAAANASSTVSSNPNAAIASIDTAIGNVNKAISDMEKNIVLLTQMQTEAQKIKADLETAKGMSSDAEGCATASVTKCVAHCVCQDAECYCSCNCCVQGCPAPKQTVKNTQTATAEIDSAIADTASAEAAIKEAIAASNQALTELLSARTQLLLAKASMQTQGLTMNATQGAAGFDRGKFLGILGTYAALGAVAGGLMGGAFGDDPCKQRVTGTLMDYVMNLKTDALPVKMDKTGIAAAWQTDDAQVFGTYDKQQVGIEFTNMSIEEGRPVYATATISATRHYHSPTTTIKQGNSSFGPFKVPDQRTETYMQKFHLKFNTKEVVEQIPPLPMDESCLMGTLIGATGEEALPKVKLNWSWSETSGIGLNECDYLNDNAVYCDATQFSIMVNKRLHALDEFLRENTPLQCPPNPAIDGLAEIGAEFNDALLELGLMPFVPSDTPNCWLPKSTALFDGKPALLYYIEANKDKIKWTDEIPDIDALNNILHFKAYLMKDGYTPDMQRDFAEFYSTKSFYDPPEWFVGPAAEKLADFFKDDNALSFRTRYAGYNQLPSAGLYDVSLAINFFNNEWRLFSANRPSAQVVVDLYLAENPFPDSIFYYLPFNGNIGKDSSNGRIGYGLNFENREQNVLVSSIPGDTIDTGKISGSNTVSTLETELESNIKKINASPSTRGILLNVAEGGVYGKKMTFSPNYATPVLMRLNHAKEENPFSVFYQLQDVLTPVEAGSNLAFWSGAGQCLDFSGVPAFESFDFKPDREATNRDGLTNWEFAYAIDWQKADYGGDVYLKTVLFTPISGTFKIKALQPSNLLFVSPDSPVSSMVELGGISGMQRNNRAALDKANSLQDIFDLVESRQVCVSNSGTRTAFWWNPKAVNETAGSNGSIAQIEQSLVAGQNCIGYGG
jgi:hypothetical protein